MTAQASNLGALARRRTLPVLMLGGVLLAGCASVGPRPGFDDVRQTLNGRLDQSIVWPQTPAERQSADRQVERLLTGPLNADAAVQIALLNNPTLQAHYETLGISSADVVAASMIGNPVLSASVGFADGGTKTGFSIIQNVLSLITRPANKQIASREFEQQRLQVADAVLDLAAKTKQAYYTVVADQQLLDMFRTAADSTEAAAALAARQRAAGTLSPVEQTEHQTLYAETLLRVSEVEARRVQDREALNRLLGLWGPQTDWRVPKRLPALPDTPLELTKLEATAIRHRLDLAAARTRVQTLSMALDAAHRFRFLGLLGVGVSTEKELDGTWITGPTLELGLPFFDRDQADLARVEARRAQSRAQMAALAVDIRSDVRAARARMLSARRRAEYFRNVLLPLRESLMAQTQRYYNGMLVGVYDLLNAKRDQLRTAREYVQALRDYWTSHAELERAAGGLLAAPQRRPVAGAEPINAPSTQGGES